MAYRKQPFTEAIQWEIYQLYYLPPRLTAAELARVYGTSPAHIRRIAGRIKELRTDGRNYAMASRHPNHPLALERDVHICNDYLGGATLSRLARDYGVSIATVSRILIRHGYRPAKKGR